MRGIYIYVSVIGGLSSEHAKRLEAEEAEKRVKDRIQQRHTDQNSVPESPTEKRTLTAAEKRALEAEKRAAWRQQRMKELEEDAMRAQVVISQVKAMSASSLEGLAIPSSPEGERKSGSDNELRENGRLSSSSSTKST